MLLITLPISIIIGIIISNYYAPTTKAQKIWTSILIPLISGIIINIIAAACCDMRWGFAFNLGRTMPFIAIPEVALFITLLIALKVGGKKKLGDHTTLSLHYGVGENRVDFTVTLTQDEILKMAKLRSQNPEKWKDNELELVKAVNESISYSIINTNKQEADDNTIPVTLHTLTEAGPVEFEVRLSPEENARMNELRLQDPDKWKDNDVELVWFVKRELKNGNKENIYCQEEQQIDAVIDNEIDEEGKSIETPNNIDNENEKGDNNSSNTDSYKLENADTRISSIFDDKLESEYRREHKTEPHWIRQNGTEMCINIDDAVYRKMVELQSGNPQRWVDKELDLFYKAQKMMYDIETKNRSSIKMFSLDTKHHKNKKWIWFVSIVVGIIVAYCVFANYYDGEYANCNESRMISMYGYCMDQKLINCREGDFRIRMISSKFYQKKIYSKLPVEIQNRFDGFNNFNRYFEISNSMWIPFVWML